MRWIRTIAWELLGLFVDDGSFALAILGWLILIWAAVPHFHIVTWLKGPLLLFGLVVILCESAIRAAKPHQEQRP